MPSLCSSALAAAVSVAWGRPRFAPRLIQARGIIQTSRCRHGPQDDGFANDEDDDAVEYLRSVVENEGGLTFAAEVMQGYITRAVEMLADYEDSEYRSALVNLCAYIAERDR